MFTYKKRPVGQRSVTFTSIEPHDNYETFDIYMEGVKLSHKGEMPNTLEWSQNEETPQAH